MQALQGSVIQRNDVTDPSTSKVDLNAAISIPITVRVAANPVGSGVLASVTDINGTPVSNPLTTDNNGNYLTYTSDGVYDVIANEGLTNETIEAGVILGGGDSPLYDGVKYLPKLSYVSLKTSGFYTGGDLGGGEYTWEESASEADHNGGTIIAYDALTAWNGTASDLSTLFGWVGTGTGCFVLCGQEGFTIDQFGVSSTSTASENTYAINQAISNLPTQTTLSCDGEEYSFDGDINFTLEQGSSVYLLAIFNVINGGVKFEGRDCDFKIGGIKTTATGSGNGLTITNAISNRITVNTIIGFYRTCFITSDAGNRGTFNNNITLPDLECSGDNEAACVYVSATSGGWCNQNIIDAGYMRGPRGTYFVQGVGQNARFDGNKLLFPQYEEIGYIAAEFNYCNYNELLYPRFEGVNPPSSYWVLEAADCLNTVMHLNFPTKSDKLSLLGEKRTFTGRVLPTDSATGTPMYISEEVGVFTDKDFVRYNLTGRALATRTLNHTWFHRDTDTTDDAFTKYFGYAKDGEGDIRPFGILGQYGYHEVLQQTGDQQIPSDVSSILVDTSDGAGLVNLIMPANKEIDGYIVKIEVVGDYSDITISDSDNTLNISSGDLYVGVNDLTYKDDAWYVNPYATSEIGFTGFDQIAGQTGVQTINKRTTFVEVNVNAGAVTLQTQAIREFEGETFDLQITHVAGDLTLIKSDGTVSQAAGNFTAGLWKMVYKYGQWRGFLVATNYI